MTARRLAPDRTLLGDLVADLQTIGMNAGLDACGVCSADPFEEAAVSLREGLEAGRDAGMQFTYRNPSRSTDPAVSLPGARAMFVGAKDYARSPRTLPTASRPRASVAMYSWSDHYRTLREALGAVAHRIEEDGWKARVLVDDNALVDRAAAVRAGIGWYGRNTNVLLPRRGSFFVLGSVVTDAPIQPPDSGGTDAGSRGAGTSPRTMTPGPVPDGCGSCRRCVDSCPTGALDGSGHLDARLCLAWLLQAPGSFPRELRAVAGNRIYGCDDCQDSCPVNRAALRRLPPSPAGEESQDSVDIFGLLASSDEELLREHGRWYIPERDPSYLRRNALIALGNCGDPRSPMVESALTSALRHPEPIVREHAVWAAARLGRADLLDIVVDETDPAVLEELRAAGEVEVRETAAAP